MHSARMRRLVAAGLVSVTSFAALSGVASAQPDPEVVASDVQTLVDNLPSAGETLAAKLQEAAATAQETQSAEATSKAVGQALVESNAALVVGTEQFEALGLGVTLIDTGAQNALAPYLQAADDPSAAPDLLTPDDVTAIAEGIQPAAEAVRAGVQEGAPHLLRGNVIEPPLGAGPAFWSATGFFMLEDVWTAFQTTPAAPFIGLAGVTALVAGAAAEPYVSDAETQVAPAFEAASPATEQLISVIEGL